MSDIIERLRIDGGTLHEDAIAEIERLEYENEQLHLALALVKDTAIPEMERMRDLLRDMRKWMNCELGDWDIEFTERIDAILGKP